MPSRAAIFACTFLVALGVAGRLHAQAPPACTDAQLRVESVSDTDWEEHRLFELPVVRYPFGERPASGWRFAVELRVEPDGRVGCIRPATVFSGNFATNPRREAALASVADWRYAPFLREGRAVPVVLTEYIHEQEEPERHVPLPEIPLDAVEIELSVDGGYGGGASFRLDLRGDGRVTYEGRGGVDVEGTHAYTVPIDEVAALVAMIRAEDVWSAREHYFGMHDVPGKALRLRFGTGERVVRDEGGALAGMPLGVQRVHDAVRRVARVEDWITLSAFALDRLEAEGFDVRSRAAGELLARALARTPVGRSDTIRRLVDAGAPLDVVLDLGWNQVTRRSLEMALERGRVELVAPLVARGAIGPRARPDRVRLDAAFRAAIRGGNLDAVKATWALGGSTPPSLTHAGAPVTLLLIKQHHTGVRWEGMAIARWLHEQGADLRARAANGDSLLHRAAGAGDAEFVRYLLAQGLDPDGRGEFGLTPLGSASREDVAMALLQAGAEPGANDEPGESHTFRVQATEQRWGRVLAWLDAHPSPAR